MLTLSSVDNLVSFANRKITVWLSFEERMDCLLFVHVINSCKGRVGVTGISLILDWENEIYSLGLGFSHWEWDEQLSGAYQAPAIIKWEWDFFSSAVFAPIF